METHYAVLKPLYMNVHLVHISVMHLTLTLHDYPSLKMHVHSGTKLQQHHMLQCNV